MICRIHPRPTHTLIPPRAMVCALLLALALAASIAAAAPRPAPAVADVSYGPHADQLLDVYLPAERDPAGRPWPVLVWYGGIWKPSKGVPDPSRFLPNGCAMIAVQTRAMSSAPPAGDNSPIAAVMDDACRAVQFVRLNAAKWNLDPRRIALGGGSQGTLPALYVACADDRADPKSADPVERTSTAVLCVGAYRSQPSIDPRRMQEWVPGVKWGAPALGYNFDESLRRRDELLPLINRWSPDALLSKRAPPIYFENNWGLTRPDAVGEMDYLVHSPAWALGFQKLAHQRGATCHVKYPDHPTKIYKDVWDFLTQQLKAPVP